MPDYSLNPMAADNDFAYRQQIEILTAEINRLRAALLKIEERTTDPVARSIAGEAALTR